MLGWPYPETSMYFNWTVFTIIMFVCVWFFMLLYYACAKTMHSLWSQINDSFWFWFLIHFMHVAVIITRSYNGNQGPSDFAALQSTIIYTASITGTCRAWCIFVIFRCIFTIYNNVLFYTVWNTIKNQIASFSFPANSTVISRTYI